MNLSRMKDEEVLTQLKMLVQNERELLTSILHHLREVEKRRLFSELKYSSLFEYAIKELKYSEPQAGRRISAMRLLKELPLVENKIQSGSLNLSNLCQAHTYFRAADKKAKTENSAPMTAQEKFEVLEQLENKSARDGEKFLISLQPELALPQEKVRNISEELSEVRFLMDEQMRERLEQVRSLLGLRGLNLSIKELTNEMAQLSIQILEQRAFGKKRVLKAKKFSASKIDFSLDAIDVASSDANFEENNKKMDDSHWEVESETESLSTSKVTSKNYVSKDLKFRVWQRDKAQCTLCGGKLNLNFDHIRPKAMGGANTFENLRLLCFHCNQRRATKTFGESARH